MKAAAQEIDWNTASDDSGLASACRAAASVAAQFEAARPKDRPRLSTFSDLFRRLYAAARSTVRG